MTIKNEFVAALTLFFASSYIIVINPILLSQAGMPFDAVFTATLLVSIFTTLFSCLLASFPFAFAPGMSLNAFFAYTVVLESGLRWQEGLAAMFLASLIIFFLTLVGWRLKILKAIPQCLVIATSAGIGLFLAFIGLRMAHIVVANPATFVALGPLHSTGVLWTVFGLITTLVLLIKNKPWAFLGGIVVITALNFATHPVTTTTWVSLPPSLNATFFQLDFAKILTAPFWTAVIGASFIFLFDGASVFLALLKQLNRPLQQLGKDERILYADSFGGLLGSVIGSSPTSLYVESTTAIASGGRTRLVSLFFALFFACCLFIEPVAKMIPPQAAAPALIWIGVLMIRNLKELNWNDLSDVLPAFVVILMTPLTFTVATGLSFGLIVFVLAKWAAKKHHEITPIVYALAFLSLMRFIWLY